MEQDKGKMDELSSYPSFENFCYVYLGMAYVGYQLEEYTVKGVKKIHATISSRLNDSSKCTSRCSLQFGRDLPKWCALCENWRINLTEYMHSDRVAWERMKSWKWPESYTNIVEIFVPTICSANTPFLQDLYVQSYIWTNCNAFKINPSTLHGLWDVRNAIVHNSTTRVASSRMDKCFEDLQTLLSDSDVDAYLNSIECKECLYSIQDVQSSKNEGLTDIVLSNVLFTEGPKYKSNSKGSELHTSNYTRQNIYKEFQVHQKIINSLNMHILQQPNHKSFLYAGLLFLKACSFFMLMNADITLIEKALRLISLDIPVFPKVLAGPNVLMLYHIIRDLCLWVEGNIENGFGQFLIPRLLQQLSDSKTLIEERIHAVTSKGEWDRCLNTEDVTLLTDLIHQGFLPDREQLDRTCAVFSQSSMIIDLITDKICISVAQQNADKIRRVWAAYEPCRENHIVFVIITKEKVENTYIKFRPDYDLRFRQDGDFNSESKEIILEESAQDLFPEKDDIIKVQACMKESTSTLMKNHSNLSLISASLLKCKGYGTDFCKTERLPCIVLHVHVKGLIPLRESLFPMYLGDINIDVREGCMLLNSGKGPHAKHQNVKIGCGIKANNQDACGTLGGFIEHPQYGLCALTCAHAMIDDIKPLKKQRKEFENEDVECVQPCYEIGNPEGSRFGILKLTVLREGTSEGLVGLDYALIAVKEDRKPFDGSFPSAKLKELNDAGFRSPPSFKTGEVIDFTTIAGRRTSIVKYGSTTLLTCGTIKWLNPTISFQDQSSGIMLLNQIQINLTKTQGKNSFSGGGDSGALIFKVDDNERLTAVGLLVAGNEKIGFSVATPICDILADIGVQRLKNFTDSIVTESESVNQYRIENGSPLKKCCRYFCKKIRTFFFGNRSRRFEQN